MLPPCVVGPSSGVMSIIARPVPPHCLVARAAGRPTGRSLAPDHDRLDRRRVASRHPGRHDPPLDFESARDGGTADAPDSKSGDRKVMGVRISLPGPSTTTPARMGPAPCSQLRHTVSVIFPGADETGIVAASGRGWLRHGDRSAQGTAPSAVPGCRPWRWYRLPGPGNGLRARRRSGMPAPVALSSPGPGGGPECRPRWRYARSAGLRAGPSRPAAAVGGRRPLAPDRSSHERVSQTGALGDPSSVTPPPPAFRTSERRGHSVGAARLQRHTLAGSRSRTGHPGNRACARISRDGLEWHPIDPVIHGVGDDPSRSETLTPAVATSDGRLLATSEDLDANGNEQPREARIYDDGSCSSPVSAFGPGPRPAPDSDRFVPAGRDSTSGDRKVREFESPSRDH